MEQRPDLTSAYRNLRAASAPLRQVECTNPATMIELQEIARRLENIDRLQLCGDIPIVHRAEEVEFV